MNDKKLYADILGVKAPWSVSAVELDMPAGRVEIRVTHAAGRVSCPGCDAQCPRHDSVERSWRHLDTCQLVTTLVSAIPRARCPECGVKQVAVPWSEPRSRFTALFEAVVISWLKDASTSAVAAHLQLSWDQVAGIQQRAVQRGLKRRERHLPRRIGIDETSFQKRHEYVTVVTDLNSGAVIHVADGRKGEVLDAFYAPFTDEERSSVEAVSMDMWPAYISATRRHIPDADSKICFDKFHVAKHLGDAVNKVRRQEHRALISTGDTSLAQSRFIWLRNPENMDRSQKLVLAELRKNVVKTSRAWAIKEYAMSLWNYVSRTWAKKGWMSWYSWAIRSQLEPIKKSARMVKRHLWGIINAIVLRVNNGRAEGVNNLIQRLKRRAFGYRNRDNFRNAILFHLGGLDLYPDNTQGLIPCHANV